MQSNAQKRPLGLQIAIYTFAGLWLLMAAFPFVWTVWGSFKVELDFFRSRTGLTRLPASGPKQNMDAPLQERAMRAHG